MSRSKNNKENKQELVHFLTVDFKDTSDKLESTDKKVQFFMQVYISLITAVLAAFAAGFIEEPTDNASLYVAAFMLAFALIGQFTLLYMLSGLKIHCEYINRLNYLRHEILSCIGKNRNFISKYGYTSSKQPEKSGMTYWMIYLMILVSAIFSGFGIGFLVRHFMREKYPLCSVVVGSVLLGGIHFFINVAVTIKNHSKMMDIYRRYQDKYRD